MAANEPELLEERKISGRGLFVIPDSDEYRHFWLYCSVKRLPKVNFTNSKWNPDRSEYAKITWIRKDYVIREDVLNYENQCFEFAVDSTGYLATAMVCMYESIVGYLDYLAPYVDAPPLPSDPENRIYVEPLRTTPQQIKIVCRGDTYVNCKLYLLNYDVNCPEATPTPKEPPDPPIEEQVPPGTPLEVSPPYDDVDDDGDTDPSDIDDFPPPPSPFPYGGECQVIALRAYFNITNSSGVVSSTTRNLTSVAPLISMRSQAASGTPNPGSTIIQVYVTSRNIQSTSCLTEAERTHPNWQFSYVPGSLRIEVVADSTILFEA